MMTLPYRKAIDYLQRLEGCLSSVSDPEKARAAFHLFELMRAERLFLESREALPTDWVVSDSGFPSSATLEADVKTIWQQGPQMDVIIQKALDFEAIGDDGPILPYLLVRFLCEGEKRAVSVEMEAKEKGLLGSRKLGVKMREDKLVTFRWKLFDENQQKLLCLQSAPDIAELSMEQWGFRYFDESDSAPSVFMFAINEQAGVSDLIEVYSSNNLSSLKSVSLSNFKNEIANIRKQDENAEDAGHSRQWPLAVRILSRMPVTADPKLVIDFLQYRALIEELKKKTNMSATEAREMTDQLNSKGVSLRGAFQLDSSLKNFFQAYLDSPA